MLKNYVETFYLIFEMIKFSIAIASLWLWITDWETEELKVMDRGIFSAEQWEDVS